MCPGELNPITIITSGMSLFGREDLLQCQNLLLGLLQLRLPLLPLPLLLLRAELLEVPADDRVSGRVDVLQVTLLLQRLECFITSTDVHI